MGRISRKKQQRQQQWQQQQQQQQPPRQEEPWVEPWEVWPGCTWCGHLEHCWLDCPEVPPDWCGRCEGSGHSWRKCPFVGPAVQQPLQPALEEESNVASLPSAVCQVYLVDEECSGCSKFGHTVAICPSQYQGEVLAARMSQNKAPQRTQKEPSGEEPPALVLPEQITSREIWYWLVDLDGDMKRDLPVAINVLWARDRKTVRSLGEAAPPRVLPGHCSHGA
ncbi:hypothetical protein EOD39_3254 [Acipenser ruthenus]|uniref:CCHC-type domain-containing protein n=1 Tax=Acipenser ruthenus TaxID=7906 RepID=A0A444UP49_ACIRT|nr:hypothetical protein EOD39_3254 [Acipenser ruthenus]